MKSSEDLKLALYEYYNISKTTEPDGSNSKKFLGIFGETRFSSNDSNPSRRADDVALELASYMLRFPLSVIIPRARARELAEMEAPFNETMAQIASMPDLGRIGIAYGVAFAWRLFNVKFSSAENYMRQGEETQYQFIDQIEELQAMFDKKGDPEVAIGVSLANMYFAALCALAADKGNGPTVNRMADRLEPLNREGAVLLLAR